MLHREAGKKVTLEYAGPVEPSLQIRVVDVLGWMTIAGFLIFSLLAAISSLSLFGSASAEETTIDRRHFQGSAVQMLVIALVCLAGAGWCVYRLRRHVPNQA